MSGKAVRIIGKKATEKRTNLFLKTSAHSLSIIVLILSIVTFLRLRAADKLKIDFFQRIAQFTHKLKITGVMLIQMVFAHVMTKVNDWVKVSVGYLNVTLALMFVL